MKNELFSKIRCAAFLVFINLLWIIPCGIKYTEDYLKPVETVETIDVLREETLDVSIEPLVAKAVYAPKEVSLGTFRLTAYCPCSKCCSKSDGITSSGTKATQGRTVAVDPSIIPYGTVLFIEGYGEFVAEDSGGKWIQQKEIDIFFDSHEEAIQFGIQYAEVFIKESN